MKRYNKPKIELLSFDEREILMASGTYSADQLNQFFYGEKGTETTTTIMVQKVNKIDN